MKPAITALTACCALALLAGCGSSGSSTTSSATTASTAASGSSSSGLKADTTPKYASPPSSAPVQSGTVQVAYRNIAINPDTVKVKVGSTIKWTNFDSVEHNVTSQGSGPQKFASKDFGESATYEIKANKPGVIHYLCTIHPASMNGTIEVVK
jgi:plastocyanin